MSDPATGRTGQGWHSVADQYRAEQSVQGLVAGIAAAEAALRVRLNELLDADYSYDQLGEWLGISRSTFYRRYVGPAR